MITQNRATLKKYFRLGARPTAEQFAQLIDSALIMDDEGFSKTSADGLRVATHGADALLSFHRQLQEPPEWGFNFLDGNNDRLALGRVTREGRPALLTFSAALGAEAGAGAPSLGPNAGVGIGVDRPSSALHVAGAIRSEGRLGHEWLVPADGKWQTISEVLGGCVAFEIMAGVGSPTTGRFALLHGVALNTFNPSPWDDLFRLKKRIRSDHAYYARWSDRLQLRWQPVGDTLPAKDPKAAPAKDPNQKYGLTSRYVLRIRSRTAYPSPSPKIRAFVTRLWYDPYTDRSADPPKSDSQFILPTATPAADTSPAK